MSEELPASTCLSARHVLADECKSAPETSVDPTWISRALEQELLDALVNFLAADDADWKQAQK
jgi:hypothetical protein